MQIGKFQGTVLLKPTLPDGKKLPVRLIEFDGEIVPDVQSEPALVQVGGRFMGESFGDTVVLRSLTENRFSVRKIEREGDGLTVEALGVNGPYRITQVVLASGAQTTRLHLQVESNGQGVTVTVPVTYTGLEKE
jgi:hypothetical protein